ncbi:MAG: MBL fold metallo-hydrolase [Oscillospiraceae bacterium]|nr:MBL fold metallo-hydrolase [Oscillospiraceae bacterium]
MPTLKIKRIAVGNGNCYLLVNGRDAVLVDTGLEKYADKVAAACKDYHMKLLVLTHGHIDHVQNAAFLQQWLQVPVAMHRADLDLLVDNQMQPLSAKTLLGKAVLMGSNALFQQDIPMFQPDFFLEDGDTLEQWGIPARVVALPGHTRGSIGLDIVKKHLIAGDALMHMFYPTVSMLYHDREEMLKSVKKISAMGERTIWFGHGKPVKNRLWIHL